MNLIEIENRVKELMNRWELDKENFIYDFLRCYDIPKASITKLKNGNTNIADDKEDAILWKNKLYFKKCDSEKIYEEYANLTVDNNILRNKPMFIIITDYSQLLALDIRTKDTLDIEFNKIIDNYTFFLPWAGMEKAELTIDNPADLKAANKMMKMYDEIRKKNSFDNESQIHELNLFLARLLFCFFAEDTGIFEEKVFTKSIISYTQQDGSDLDLFLKKVFKVLNEEKREGYVEYLKKFPYVGGDLFDGSGIELKFNSKSRQAIIENGELDWSEINPDIFGSMIQTVVNADERSNLGMHYTSVPNIMKVINSLFLDELNDEFESHKNDVNKLKKLIDRLSKIKIFDPACGSGNFLIIAYKEMRELEMRIINQINKIDRQIYMKETGISLDQFYGIELKDFAQQIAKLSLWLIEKKMDFRFYNEFGHSKPLLPLVESSRIINGNATRLEWNEICGISSEDEIYVLGNPPYLGSKVQDSEQRQDMDIVFKGIKKYKELDYIACWFYKGAKFIKGYNAKCAFVSTNSICQGEQVGLLWPNIFNQGIIIDFAHTSFKWGNNAKKNAAVICVIVGIVNNYEKNNRKIYQNNIVRVVKNINPYLIPGENIIIKKTKKTISALPPIFFGSMANDNNNLLLSNDAKEEIIRMNPNASKYIKKLIGAKQITQNQQRWCIWLKDVEKDIINKIEEFNTRIDMVREYRLNSTREATRKLAQTPHLFGEIRQPQHNYIAIPRHSSEKREYIPINMYTKDDIVNDSCMAVETNELWIMGVLMSYMHMLWVRTVGGRIKTDYRYSADICYNAFPFPNISNKKKDIISGYTIKVIEEREKNSGKTLAELYNPETMPLGLREAHNNLNLVIERCYIEKEFKTDEERLECLFKLYEEMI